MFHHSSSTPSRLLKTFVPSIVVLVTISLVGFLFYVRGKATMEAELKHNLQSLANMGALQIEADWIERINGPEDKESAAYNMIVRQLRAIRDSESRLRFAYVLRRTNDPNILEFVADADALSDPLTLDRNANGQVDEDEKPASLGDKYDATDAPALREEAFLHSSVDPVATRDQWGLLMSGYAPIRKQDGTVVAVLGVDMNADEYYALSQSVFSPLLLVLICFAASLMAFQLSILMTRRRMEALEQLDAERLALMDLASHQLGSPLATFKWWLEILGDADTTVTDTKKAYQELSEGVKRMEAIMQALQSADSVTSGNVAYSPDIFPIEEIIRGAVADVRQRFSLSTESFVFSFDDKHSPVMVDPKLLGGAIGELLENAVVYAPNKGPVTIRTARQGRKVRVDIEDTGDGLSAQEVASLFHKFTRGKNAAIHKPVGNGLGLYIVKRIIEMAGGRIWVRSKQGTGTVFSFLLPIAR